MKTGPMHIEELLQLISNNIYERCGGFTIHSANAGGGARKGIATDATIAFGNPAMGEWLNVSVPDIPENSLRVWNPHVGRGQFTPGWRQILVNIVNDGTIRFGDDIRRVLWPEDHHLIKQDSWRARYIDPETSFWAAKQTPSVAESHGRHQHIQAAKDAARSATYSP